MIIEFDDFGCNHIISDQCQSHDCRDALDKLHYINPSLKVTLFAIPAEMTYELLDWCKANSSWIELAVHGFTHNSNYECEKMTYDEFFNNMEKYEDIIEEYFVKGFRAPGWQISIGAFDWLNDNDWWVADQSYNDSRRPKRLKAYVNYDGLFKVKGEEVKAHHGHTWNVGWNGIYEDFENVEQLVRTNNEFKFVSELF